MGKKSSALSLTAMLAAASTSIAGSDANGELFDWRIVLRSSTGEVPLLPFNGFPGRFQTTNHLHSTDTRFLCFISASIQKYQGSMPGLARYVWTVGGEPQASNGAGIGVPFAPRYVSINGSPMNALVFYIGRGPAGGNTIGLRGARNVVGTPDDVEGFRSGVRWWHADRTWGETDPRGLWTVIDGAEGISFEVQKAFDIDDTHVREFEFTARFEAAFSNDPRPLVATELTEPAEGASLFGTFRNFRWTATPNATDYFLYISEDPAFADIGPGGRSPVYVPGQWGTSTESVPTYLSTQTLILDRQFYWKVVARNCFFETNEAITPVRSFRTFSAVQPPPPPPPAAHFARPILSAVPRRWYTRCPADHHTPLVTLRGHRALRGAPYARRTPASAVHASREPDFAGAPRNARGHAAQRAHRGSRPVRPGTGRGDHLHHTCVP